jgi:hypothetical protein
MKGRKGGRQMEDGKEEKEEGWGEMEDGKEEKEEGWGEMEDGKEEKEEGYRWMAVRRSEGSQITEGRRVLNSERKRKVQTNK